jgi:hypothetical protein
MSQCYHKRSVSRRSLCFHDHIRGHAARKWGPYRSSGASLRVTQLTLRLANIVPPPGATVLPGRFLGGLFGTSWCFGGFRELGANAKADPFAGGEMDRRPAADRFNGARRDR